MRGKGVGRGGRLCEAGRLLTFSALRMGAYSNKYGICRNCVEDQDRRVYLAQTADRRLTVTSQ